MSACCSNMFYINLKLRINFGFNISWKRGFPLVQDITQREHGIKQHFEVERLK